ncbi:MAG TPA: right-handed parallel beta-helix repeat-containing protein [Gemmatimonadales bacterium]|nr:right-handed parallel beta-helix repeat-containing protein [Gemmatimonadales bacterium]
MRLHLPIALGSALVAVAACSPDQSTSVPADSPATITVTSNGDGAGSLADALARAGADQRITEIALGPGVTSVGSRPLSFVGSQLLTINGGGATITGETLHITGAPAGVVIRNLTVAGAPGNGIEIDVPSGATGDYVVRLQNVTVTDAVDHGVLVEDQIDNSAASIVLEVLQGTFTGNGNVAGASVSDRDGIRVNEGGMGDIRARIVGSKFTGNGADGVELDEKGDGDVHVEVVGTSFDDNGPFDTEDYDDGIDVDEDGAGDIVARFTNTTANGNFDQGIDLNENDAGDMDVTLVNVSADGNGGEGIDLEEDDDVDGGGNLLATLTNVSANGNGRLDGAPGAKIEEDGPGSLVATLTDITASNNSEAGLSLEQQGRPGDARGQVTITRLVAEGNPDGPYVTDGPVDVTLVP